MITESVELTSVPNRDLQSEIVVGQVESAGTVSDEPAAASNLTSLFEAMQSLNAGFQQLQQGFDSKLKYDASKERVIDTLHKELQSYREGLHFKILRPLIMDLIAIYDDMDNVLKHTPVEENDTAAVKTLRRNLETFQESIEEILVRNGVEVYSEVDDTFNAQRQRAIRVVATETPEQDKMIAARIRKGFAYEGRVLRPEMVLTFKWTAPTNQPTDPLPKPPT